MTLEISKGPALQTPPSAQGGQRRRQREPEQRLARILAAATDAFARDGYARSRIQDICRAAGVSVGTFYQHFEDKRELLLHLVEGANESAPLPDVSSLERLRDQVATYVCSAEAGLWRTWAEALLAEPKLAEAGERLRLYQVDRLETWVRSVRAKQGAIRPPIDDRTAAWLVLMTAREMVLMPRANAVDRSKVADALWAILFGG